MERQSDWPCIICGANLERVFTDEGQPNDGVVCTTHGNYGSTVFDDLTGEYLAFNICDSCLTDKAAEGRVMITRSSIPVQLDIQPGICGAYPVDRPYVPWHVGMEPWDERFTVSTEEIVEGTYPRDIRWNDRGQSNWPETLLAGYLHEHPDELADLKRVEGYAERLDAMMASYEVLLAERRRELGL